MLLPGEHGVDDVRVAGAVARERDGIDKVRPAGHAVGVHLDDNAVVACDQLYEIGDISTPG